MDGNPGHKPWALDALVVAFISLPMPMVALVLALFPADAPANPQAVLAGFAATLAIAALYLRSLRTRTYSAFIVLSLLAVAGNAMTSIWLGIGSHRDFFTSAFESILAYPLVFLYRLWAKSRGEYSSMSMRAISRAGFAIAAFFTVWIMMMGYAISTRAEPRPLQSIIYNCYNLILAVALALESHGLELSTWHTLSISPKALRLDDKDLVPILGKKKSDMLRAFTLSPDRTLHCREIQAALEGGGEGDFDCGDCDKDTAKATACPHYRSTYNSLLEIKRTIEFLGIGTITAPENKRRILAEGWKLAIFEGVRIQAREG
jgi:hypothetical protein